MQSKASWWKLKLSVPKTTVFGTPVVELNWDCLPSGVHHGSSMKGTMGPNSYSPAWFEFFHVSIPAARVGRREERAMLCRCSSVKPLG